MNIKTSNWDKASDAWQVEAADINIDEISNDDFNEYFIVKQEVKEFLTSPNKKIIKAPKGYGKTLFLRKKAHHYAKFEHRNETFPANHLCEDGKYQQVPLLEDNRFRKNYYIFTDDIKSKGKISQKISNLKLAWEYAFTKAAFEYLHNKSKEKSKDETNLVLKHFNNALMRDVTELNNEMQNETISTFDTECYIFIDNIDKMVNFGYEVQFDSEDNNTDVNVFQFWVAIQVAFCVAVAELPKKHIHIYGAVRHEALGLLDENYFEYSDRTKLSRLITKLDYTKADLEKIFYNNIALAFNESTYSNHEYNDIAKRYFGLTHSYIVNKVVSNKNETLFEYIYRHSLYKPRDIIELGSKLKYLINVPSSRRILELKEIVHSEELYKNIIGDYLTEIGSVLQGRLNVLRKYPKHMKNILTYDDIKDGCRWINRIAEDDECDECDDCPNEHYFCYMYNAGLLGVEVPRPRKVYQKFQLPHERLHVISGGMKSIYNLNSKNYFFLHPLIYGRAKMKINTNVLIGDEGLFYEKIKYNALGKNGVKYAVEFSLGANWRIILKVHDVYENIEIFNEVLCHFMEINNIPFLDDYFSVNAKDKMTKYAKRLMYNDFSEHVGL